MSSLPDSSCDPKELSSVQDQLRIYTIKPGEMGVWLDEWQRLIAPLRRRHGFGIIGAWTVDREDNCVLILRYAGPKPWQQADDHYQPSPDSGGMQPDPAKRIEKTEHWMMAS